MASCCMHDRIDVAVGAAIRTCATTLMTTVTASFQATSRSNTLTPMTSRHVECARTWCGDFTAGSLQPMPPHATHWSLGRSFSCSLRLSRCLRAAVGASHKAQAARATRRRCQRWLDGDRAVLCDELPTTRPQKLAGGPYTLCPSHGGARRPILKKVLRRLVGKLLCKAVQGEGRLQLGRRQGWH